MKRIFALLLMLFVMTLPVFAQDSTPVPDVNADAPAPEIVAAATQEAPAVTPAPQPATNDNMFAVAVLLISNVISYGIILAQAIMQNGSVNRKTLDSFFSGLKGLARIIPGDTDDKLVGAIESGVDAFVGQGITPESKVTIETKPAGAG